jgi:hypothetical protein
MLMMQPCGTLPTTDFHTPRGAAHGFQAMDHGVIDEVFTFIAGSNAGCIDYVSFSAAMERVPPNLRACW